MSWQFSSSCRWRDPGSESHGLGQPECGRRGGGQCHDEKAPATSILSLPEGESTAGSRTGFYTVGIQPGRTQASPGPPTQARILPHVSGAKIFPIWGKFCPI